MSEFVRVFPSCPSLSELSEFVRVCLRCPSSPRLSEFVRVSPSLSALVRVCPSLSELSEFVSDCPNLSEIVRVCPSSSEFVGVFRVCPSLSRFVRVCPSCPSIHVHTRIADFRRIHRRIRSLVTSPGGGGVECRVTFSDKGRGWGQNGPKIGDVING